MRKKGKMKKRLTFDELARAENPNFVGSANATNVINLINMYIQTGAPSLKHIKPDFEILESLDKLYVWSNTMCKGTSNYSATIAIFETFGQSIIDIFPTCDAPKLTPKQRKMRDKNQVKRFRQRMNTK
jgi:hypothetical protein